MVMVSALMVMVRGPMMVVSALMVMVSAPMVMVKDLMVRLSSSPSSMGNCNAAFACQSQSLNRGAG